METINLLEATNSTVSELLTIADFYDRALHAALTGACANAHFSKWVNGPAPVDLAPVESYARFLTERRFGVKLVLPGDGE